MAKKKQKKTNKKTGKPNKKVPPSPKSALRLVLQVVALDETGDSYYRMRWPGHQLAEQNSDWAIVNIEAHHPDRFKLALEADLLVLFQCHDSDFLPIVHKRREQGLKTLVEYNDNFYAPPSASPVAKEWNSPLVWSQYEAFMALADGILVTGPGLNELFNKVTNSPIHEIFNLLPEAPDERFAHRESSPIVRIGWAGSLGHMSDLIHLKPVLQRILTENANVQFKVMGNSAIPDMLGLPKERLRFTPWGSMADYFRFLEETDIGLIAALDTPYNRCRSDIKAVELASRGAVPVLPMITPYLQLLEEGPWPRYKTLEELYNEITHLIKKPKDTQKLREKLFHLVSPKRVSLSNTERSALYEAHFPNEPTAKATSLSPGYHEERSKRQFSPLGFVRQELSGIKALDERRERAFEKHTQNPGCPDRALIYLQELSRSSWSEAHELAAEFQKKFPRDFRFLLVPLSRCPNPGLLFQLWDEFLGKLESSPPQSIRFFETQSVQLFLRSLSVNVKLLEYEGRMLLLFPDSARLRHGLARGFEQLGYKQEAWEHFAWLLRERELYQKNSDLFAELDIPYFQVWVEALGTK